MEALLSRHLHHFLQDEVATLLKSDGADDEKGD